MSSITDSSAQKSPFLKKSIIRTVEAYTSRDIRRIEYAMRLSASGSNFFPSDDELRRYALEEFGRVVSPGPIQRNRPWLDDALNAFLHPDVICQFLSASPDDLSRLATHKSFLICQIANAEFYYRRDNGVPPCKYVKEWQDPTPSKDMKSAFGLGENDELPTGGIHYYDFVKANSANVRPIDAHERSLRFNERRRTLSENIADILEHQGIDAYQSQSGGSFHKVNLLTGIVTPERPRFRNICFIPDAVAETKLRTQRELEFWIFNRRLARRDKDVRFITASFPAVPFYGDLRNRHKNNVKRISRSFKELASEMGIRLIFWHGDFTVNNDAGTINHHYNILIDSSEFVKANLQGLGRNECWRVMMAAIKDKMKCYVRDAGRLRYESGSIGYMTKGLSGIGQKPLKTTENLFGEVARVDPPKSRKAGGRSPALGSPRPVPERFTRNLFGETVSVEPQKSSEGLGTKAEYQDCTHTITTDDGLGNSILGMPPDAVRWFYQETFRMHHYARFGDFKRFTNELRNRNERIVAQHNPKSSRPFLRQMRKRIVNDEELFTRNDEEKAASGDQGGRTGEAEAMAARAFEDCFYGDDDGGFPRENPEEENKIAGIMNPHYHGFNVSSSCLLVRNYTADPKEDIGKQALSLIARIRQSYREMIFDKISQIGCKLLRDDNTKALKMVYDSGCRDIEAADDVYTRLTSQAAPAGGVNSGGQNLVISHIKSPSLHPQSSPPEPRLAHPEMLSSLDSLPDDCPDIPSNVIQLHDRLTRPPPEPSPALSALSPPVPVADPVDPNAVIRLYKRLDAVVADLDPAAYVYSPMGHYGSVVLGWRGSPTRVSIGHVTDGVDALSEQIIAACGRSPAAIAASKVPSAAA